MSRDRARAREAALQLADVGRRVLRYEVPVDDRWHELWLSGEVVHVDTRRPDVVEFWALAGGEVRCRRFVVVGTAHRIPDEATRHVGSVLAAGGALAWHLFEATPWVPVPEEGTAGG